MEIVITLDDLIKQGLDEKSASFLLDEIKAQIKISISAEDTWMSLAKNVLTAYPFAIQLFIFETLFPSWHEYPETAPAIIPDTETITNANITKFMAELGTQDVHAFHRYTAEQCGEFWQRLINQLRIQFSKRPEQICALENGLEKVRWFPGAKLNITDSCFQANPNTTALIFKNPKNKIEKMSYHELCLFVNRIANSLIKAGLKTGDPIAIAMPMNPLAVAIYLAIIKMGGVVVSIADSFSSQEIAVRLKIGKAKAIFTQDFVQWGGKQLPLYEKISQAQAPFAIVLPSLNETTIQLRTEDKTWQAFLAANDDFTAVQCEPIAPCNILFSSGTTGEPKAIPWNHTTAIKAASDAFFHQNIQAGDILAWPTNLGWMMGPWLIYAALINQATIALFADAPRDQAFGQFIQDAKVTMLGVVPTLVATWRQSKCMEGLDWSNIKVFSSTGECSNPEDMLYLMSLAKYKPVIEYCGGTEVVSYISSTVIEKNYPSLFSTPSMGTDFIIIDDNGKPAEIGQVAIIPPALGLSNTVLNADHHHVYYEGMPIYLGKTLRRHGDQLRRLPNGYFSVLGRVDDTMNLGGIKISAAEIERTITGVNGIIEVAAIAITPNQHGPSQLVIYASTTASLNKQTVLQEMQKKINAYLNPLFKIQDVIFIEALPKTASNKIMRRMLRKSYQTNAMGT